MVVTRKTPAPPIPTSRTNSSQPIPRIKSKAPHESGSASSPLANGTTAEDLNGKTQAAEAQSTDVTDSPSKKGKSKGKGKHKKDKRSSKRSAGGFLELLTRVFLLFFTIYTLSVCPTDEHLKSPVCRGLHEYRRLILEPYLLPPIQYALAHPTVAPYVDRARPYADRFVATAKPIALRTHQEWNARVVPQWKKRIVPQWNKHAVPAWTKYVVPQIHRIGQRLDPYLRKASAVYERRVGPHLRLAVYNLQKWRAQAQPYVVLAAEKTYTGYQKAKPYTIPILHRLQILFADLVQFLVTQRRQFVDPHLKRIWEGVVELSGGKPVSIVHKPVRKTPVASKISKVAHAGPSVASSVVSSVHPLSSSPLIPRASDAFVGTASSVLPESVSTSESLPATMTAESDLPPSPSEGATSTTSIASKIARPISSAASVASSYTDDTASSVAETASSSASSVVSSLSNSAALSPSTVVTEAVASTIVSAPSELNSSASSLAEPDPSTYLRASESVLETVARSVSTASAGADQAHPSVTSLASTASASIHSGVPSSSATPEDDDIDLDAFYAELGLGDEPEATSVSADFVPPPEETESEEEKAEKLRLQKLETARKRADITGRHSKWEEQLEEAIADSRKTLRRQLVALRKAAVSELKESVEIRKEIEALVEEAEKFLKGAEKYLANMKRESRRPEEKRSMWERVVEKVDSRFGERLSQTEAVVNGWYSQILNQELDEVRKLSDAVRDIADRAQADIGLDYAWLDDVTYQDWQRYHDLVRTGENFTELAFSIQNGSHPSPPINPVLPALADLQSEVQDIVVGFETRLRRLKRNGDRTFGAIQNTEDSEDEESAIPEDETASILPIEQDGEKGPEVKESSPDVHQVVIGRSKEEVIVALNRAAEVDPDATSIPEDNSKDAEKVVELLASEVEDEVEAQASSSSHHEEL